MRANLNDTYTYGGKFYGPGNDIEIPSEMADSLRQRGVLPAVEGDASSPSGLSSLPPGSVAGYFVPGDSVSPPGMTRLGTGLVARPQPIFTPGDPVQRAAARPQPVVASAGERNTADPATGMPPPVVYTAEGVAVESVSEDMATQTTEAAPEDDGDEDHDTGEIDPEAETSSTGTEAATTATTAAPSRPTRVTSRPRSSSATPE